jgi:hypothetical protein
MEPDVLERNISLLKNNGRELMYTHIDLAKRGIEEITTLRK